MSKNGVLKLLGSFSRLWATVLCIVGVQLVSYRVLVVGVHRESF